ncbi:uncharacterized protein AB675_7531 [Cyphellophora attinorum]|uniref:Uncharacterized protein n=1 Tax=Cyphellophora attinorum TaxID=1664694 RepID=A0A0N0NMI0_9EURO|nr:uncharacterized protein AB675_7531 [Phialophora attinorum]KPI40378.1 hypothetical protein AB675_7531 [Phialophora attinorum]
MSSGMEPPAAIKQLLRWDQLRQTSWGQRLTDNWVNIGMGVFLLLVTAWRFASTWNESKKYKHSNRFLPAPNFPTINEQLDFDYTKTEPAQLRPFKPKYHLTMGNHWPPELPSADSPDSTDTDFPALENLNPDDLILMDKNYKSRLAYRRKILAEHPDNTCAVTDDKRIHKAVAEYYTFLTGTYLPLRYPSMFKLHKTLYETGEHFMLQNLITGEMWPCFPLSSTISTYTLLMTLGKTLDEDILFLLPEEGTEETAEPKYVLHALITCFPSGFNPGLDKLGKRLADIHGPVPGYKAKLESSMDRYFAKLEVGKYVKRANWNITHNTELYAAGSDTNHSHEGDEVEELKEIDLEKTFLRTERQTLQRLPKSKAIVFSFKTYLYPISQIRDEGSGPALAEAIEGMKGGNTPGMYFYKRGAVWGEAVKRYLRGGGGDQKVVKEEVLQEVEKVKDHEGEVRLRRKGGGG